MPIERRRVLYRGRVQGVGFRYTAHRLARGFAVAGFVRNLRDGRVEVVVEGESSDVSAFLAAIAREMGDYIRDTQQEVSPPGEPPLRGFSIEF
jgi:acylphosphatase